MAMSISEILVLVNLFSFYDILWFHLEGILMDCCFSDAQEVFLFSGFQTFSYTPFLGLILKNDSFSNGHFKCLFQIHICTAYEFV